MVVDVCSMQMIVGRWWYAAAAVHAFMRPRSPRTTTDVHPTPIAPPPPLTDLNSALPPACVPTPPKEVTEPTYDYYLPILSISRDAQPHRPPHFDRLS